MENVAATAIRFHLKVINRSTLVKSRLDNVKETSAPDTELTNGSRAFTLTELVVVIGVIALLAATLLPALAQSKTKSQAVVCLTNMRQLQRASILYANDNNDFLPNNYALHSAGDTTTAGRGRPNWVDGQMTGGGVTTEDPVGCSTNPFYLGVNGTTGFGTTLIGSIGPYVKVAEAYHCPADHFIDPRWQVLRVRSYSANRQCGIPAEYNWPGYYKSFEKYSDFLGSPLGPSQYFEFLEENPSQINDGYFDYYSDGTPPGRNDWPAVNHYRATSFSFADGHAELHQWHDIFLNTQLIGTIGPGGSDTMWLAQHGTYKLQ